MEYGFTTHTKSQMINFYKPKLNKTLSKNIKVKRKTEGNISGTNNPTKIMKK